MTDEVDNVYDVVLKLESLASIKNGFDIHYTPKGKEKIEELKKKDGCVITAIGNSNQGKSFLLSRISQIDMPSGHSISTKGLSILFPDNLSEKDSNKRFIILDTEGSQNAIKIEEKDRKEMDKLKEMEKIDRIEARARDRQMTENFLQNFALDASQIVIAVVGQLTFQDQKFLNRIKDNTKDKNLFIVHNLMFLETIEEVEAHMKDVIQSSLFFNLEKRNMIKMDKKSTNENEIYFVEEVVQGNKASHIIHLIMAREEKEAGNFYNPSTIRFLRENVQAIPKQKKFDVITEFSKYLCLTSTEYFDLPEIDEQQMGKGKILKREDIEIDGDTWFKINVPYDLNLKKCLVDEIGITSYKGLITTPPFSYFKKDNKFTIQVEYCGKLVECNVKKNILNGQYRFTILGKTEKNPDKAIVSSIEEGDFMLSFSVGLNFITIKKNEFDKQNDEKNGILNIIYELAETTAEENNEGEDLGGDDDW